MEPGLDKDETGAGDDGVGVTNPLYAEIFDEKVGVIAIKVQKVSINKLESLYLMFSKLFKLIAHRLSTAPNLHLLTFLKQCSRK